MSYKMNVHEWNLEGQTIEKGMIMTYLIQHNGLHMVAQKVSEFLHNDSLATALGTKFP